MHILRHSKGEKFLYVRKYFFVRTKIYFCTYENFFSYLRKYFFLGTKIQTSSKREKEGELLSIFQIVMPLFSDTDPITKTES